jgi:hypothetical protein
MVEGSHQFDNTSPDILTTAIAKARRDIRALLCTSLLPVYQVEHNSYATYLSCGMREMRGFGG